MEKTNNVIIKKSIIKKFLDDNNISLAEVLEYFSDSKYKLPDIRTQISTLSRYWIDTKELDVNRIPHKTEFEKFEVEDIWVFYAKKDEKWQYN